MIFGVTVGSQIARFVSSRSSRAQRRFAVEGSIVFSAAARATRSSNAGSQKPLASVVAGPLPATK